ncbi:MAG: aminotransferase class IV, partial [Actinomycetota bacterium]
SAWLDGEPVEPDSIRLPLMAHAVQRGSLVFDVFDVVVTGAGPVGLAARRHVERFLRSARLMDLPVRWSVDELLAAAGAVARATDGVRFVRLCGWWGGETVAVTPAVDDEPRVAVVAFPAPALSLDDTTVTARTADAIKLPAEVLPPTVKVAAAYTHGALATHRARADGVDEVIFLDGEGQLTESAVMSLVLVVDGVLRTAPDTSVLDGITRQIVLDLAADEGIPVEIGPLPADLIDVADEAWFSSTSHLLWPIRSIDDRVLPAAPGSIGRRLRERLADLVAGTDPRSDRWWTPLP